MAQVGSPNGSRPAIRRRAFAFWTAAVIKRRRSRKNSCCSCEQGAHSLSSITAVHRPLREVFTVLPPTQSLLQPQKRNLHSKYFPNFGVESYFAIPDSGLVACFGHRSGEHPAIASPAFA